MADSVLEATAAEAKAHPYWIVGGVLGIAALFWLLSGSSSRPAAPQAFTFTAGPSDAQLQAGTALAIAQAGNQSQVAMAGIAATAQTAVAGDYYGYLATGSANALASTVSTNATQLAEARAGSAAAVAIGAQNNATAQLAASLTAQTQQQGNATQLAMTNINDFYNYNSTVNTNATQAEISTSHDYTSGVLATIRTNPTFH